METRDGWFQATVQKNVAPARNRAGSLWHELIREEQLMGAFTWYVARFCHAKRWHAAPGGTIVHGKGKDSYVEAKKKLLAKSKIILRNIWTRPMPRNMLSETYPVKWRLNFATRVHHSLLWPDVTTFMKTHWCLILAGDSPSSLHKEETMLAEEQKWASLREMFRSPRWYISAVSSGPTCHRFIASGFI